MVDSQTELPSLAVSKSLTPLLSAFIALRGTLY